MKQLDKLLFEQGDRCFFCQQNLTKADASVEHLCAQANGGTNADENVVACCKTLNALLGSKPLKEKIQIVLRQRGQFICPAARSPQVVKSEPVAKAKPEPAPSAKSKAEPPKSSIRQVPNVVALSTPAKQSTNTPAVKRAQCPTCKSSVQQIANQSGYKCASCGTAFQY